MYQELLEWVESKNTSGIEISPDLDLIDKKLIDSISFVEYILIIEDLSDKEIHIDDAILDKVRTLESVEKHFFSR